MKIDYRIEDRSNGPTFIAAAFPDDFLITVEDDGHLYISWPNGNRVARLPFTVADALCDFLLEQLADVRRQRGSR